MKKIVIPAITLVSLFLSQSAVAQNVSPELVGVYTGTAKITNYDAYPPSKVSGSVVLQINPDSTSVMTLTGQTFPVEDFTGQAANLNQYLFVRYPVAAGFQYSGRLAAKGKTGKQSLKGQLTAMFSGYTGILDVDVKLKRLP